MYFTEKTIKSEAVYQGKILNLRIDTVTAPKGEAIREIVEHRGAVALVAITEDDKLVMVRQYRKTAERALLEIPAGKLELGEDPREAAIRELKEETGYTAEDISYMFSYYPCVGYSEEVIHMYLCQKLTAGETDFDDDEAMDTLKFSKEELLPMIDKGEIVDGKTIIGIYNWLLKSK